jgi:type III secretion protein J
MKRFAAARKRYLVAVVVMAAVASMAGCKAQVDLHHAPDMASANEMAAVLSDHGIAVERRQEKEGVTLTVADADFLRAMAALHDAGLPRQARANLGDAFGKKGMVSTPLEEKTRYIHALEQELESTLLHIDGVSAARVRVVPQERPAPGAPLSPASASVLIQHRPDIDLSALVPGIVLLVKNGVPGLAGEDDRHVAVVLVPERERSAAAPQTSEAMKLNSGWLMALSLIPAFGALAWYFHRQLRRRGRRPSDADTAPMATDG